MFVHQFIPKASTSDTVCYFNLYKLKVTGQGPPQPWRCTINTILTWVTWQFDDKWKCLLTQKPLKNIADSFAVDLGRQEGLKKQRLYFTFGQFWQQPGNKQTTFLSPNRTQTLKRESSLFFCWLLPRWLRGYSPRQLVRHLWDVPQCRNRPGESGPAKWWVHMSVIAHTHTPAHQHTQRSSLIFTYPSDRYKGEISRDTSLWSLPSSGSAPWAGCIHAF